MILLYRLDGFLSSFTFIPRGELKQKDIYRKKENLFNSSFMKIGGGNMKGLIEEYACGYSMLRESIEGLAEEELRF